MAAAVAEPMLQNLTATIRAPYSTSAAPSMADTLPSLNFGFDDLRARMSSFTQQFDEFIERGRRRVLEERNQFRMTVAEIQEQQKQKERSITGLASKSSQHAATLSAHSAETAEMQDAITTLTGTRDKHADNVGTLKQKLETVRTAITTKKATQKQHLAHQAYQASFNGPELEFWEGYLGLRIEGTGKEDRVRFVFTGMDERRIAREAWFEMDIGAYEVVGSQPKLNDAKVEKCLTCMTQGNGEDLAGFLKGMRALFSEEMR